MIQRIQTLYLFIVFLTSGIFPFIANLWETEAQEVVYASSDYAYSLLFGGSALLAIISIFLFKKRQNQFVLNRLNTILNLILLGLFVFRSLNLSGETIVSVKGIGMILPIISIVFLAAANKAIKKDENLVKSADRIR